MLLLMVVLRLHRQHQIESHYLQTQDYILNCFSMFSGSGNLQKAGCSLRRSFLLFPEKNYIQAEDS